MRHLALLLILALAACGPAPQDEAKKPAQPPAQPPQASPPVTPQAPPQTPPAVPPAAKPKPKPGPLVRDLPKKYDALIKKAVAKWNCYPIWEYWWGQLATESNHRADAVSPAGAKGIAQILDGTWADIKRKIDLGAADQFDVAAATEAGCYEMARLRREWRSPRPEEDRSALAASSYNAGLGHLLEAQRLCGMATLYLEIMACLPRVTGQKHSQETINYWPRIQRNTRRKLGF